MKRQQSLTQFLPKKPKSEPIQPEESSTSTVEIVEVKYESSSNIEDSLPECWTEQQYTYFKEKYDGLEIFNKKLGCTYCSNYNHLIKGKEWAGFQVVAHGKGKVNQQSSLRKKMWEHFSTKAHTLCKTREQDCLTEAVDNMNEKHLSTTCRVFNTVYSLSKRCRPFSDIEDEIELQIKNGLDMGIRLHSRQTAVKIVDFIAKEIIKEIFTKIAENNHNICLIIDEASTISCKPVIMIFLKVEDSVSSPTIFVELVELEKQDAETICSVVMKSLQNVGLTKDYLQTHLIGFYSDGASVMLGRKSGVSTSIAKDFPNIIIWLKYSIPPSVQRAKNIVRTFAVSSAEAERGFSNIICSKKRGRLTVSNISNLMTISLIGLPLQEWNPIPTVERWLRTHRTADDPRAKPKTIASEDASQTAIWNYLR